MIHPSYVDLMKVVNEESKNIGEEPVVNSRYSIVLSTAKRARQIIAGDEPMLENANPKKPLSTAVEELNQGLVKILTEEEKEEMNQRVEYAKERASELAKAQAQLDAVDEEM